MDDLISRQELCEYAFNQKDKSVTPNDIMRFPSAQPERKKRGRFVGTEADGYADGYPVYCEWKCSECGCIFEDEEPLYNFCPNCGADMRGEQDG